LGRVWSNQQAGQSNREDNQISGNLASGRGIFIYEFAELCDDYVIYFMLWINLISAEYYMLI
jgi:hypothetical protein